MTDESRDNEMPGDLDQMIARLPREIAPPEDAWKRIRAQIDLETQLVTMPLHHREREWWQRPAFLAAAALLLVAGASLTTALVIGRRMIDNPSRSVATRTAAPQATGVATLAEFTKVENDYIETANMLYALIERGQTELSPETIAKLKESLRVIDEAIVEARRALAADPGNKTLIEMLSASYNHKVELLRRSTAMGQT
ncbi:MAG TPA: hypothetical protein VGC52_13800 [Gemmatimonadaceae bacterium]